MKTIDLLFCPIEGRNFCGGSSDVAQIRFDATLDGDNPLQSKVFPINPRQSSFDTDLAWSMNKPSFDALVEKNAKVHVKVYEVKDCDVEDLLIGELDIDVGNSAMYFENDGNDSRRDMAEWKDMKSIQMDPPKLLCSLLAEYQGSPGRNSSEAFNTECSPFPVLNENLGYFVLGPEMAANEMFYFNVIIGCPVGIHQPNTEEEVYISYQLFGNEVRTDSFRESAEFVQEMATAKIFSTPEYVLNFFSGIEPVTFAFCGAESGTQFAVCQADFAGAFAQCPDPASVLHHGKFVDYNTSLEGDRSMEIGKKPPSLLVRLSLGKTPDDAVSAVSRLSLEMNRMSVNEESSTASGGKPVRGDRVFSTPQLEQTEPRDPRRRERRNQAIEDSAISPHFQPVVNNEHPTPNVTNEDSSTMEQDKTEKQMEVDQSIQSQEFQKPESKTLRISHKFKFQMDVKSLGLVSSSSQPFKCLLRFKKWKLNFDSMKPPAITIKPSQSLSSNLTMNDVRGVSHHVSFTATPRKVADVLDRDKLVMEVWKLSNVGRPDEKLGEAEVCLTPLKTTNAPRLLTGAVMDQDHVQVGVVKVEVMMADDGEEGGVVESSPPAATAPSSTGYVSESLEEMRAKAVLEIEDWKRNQKKEFRKQIQKNEEEHYQLLNEEWKKRLGESKAEYDRRLNELDTTEVRMVTEMKKLRGWEKRLERLESEFNARVAHQEAQFNAREAKLAQQEAQVTSKAQDLALKESEVAKREKDVSQSEKLFRQCQESLKAQEAQISQLKAKIELLVDNKGGRKGSLQENIPYFANPGSNLPVRSVATSDSSTGTPQNPHNGTTTKAQELQNIILKSHVYNENDPILKMVKQKRSSSSMK